MIVAIAAEQREFRGFLKQASSYRRLSLALQYAASCTLNGREWLLAAHGAGPRLAAVAAETAINAGNPEAVVSTGLCGGLSESLKVGDVFVATDVMGAACQVPAASGSFATGRLWSADRVAVSIEEKAELARDGYDAVDMEAAAVAEAAERHQLPFFCIRAVSDARQETLPLDFNKYRDAEGRFRLASITGAVLLRPWRIPGLVRMARQARLASDILGDFIAHCSLPS